MICNNEECALCQEPPAHSAPKPPRPAPFNQEYLLELWSRPRTSVATAT